MRQRLTLVGYRASGKSSVARRLGQRWGWPVVDVDQWVEDASGSSIPQLFAQGGEECFRDWESRALAEILAAPGPQVVATGGGAVIRADNRQLLAQQGGLVVYLSASAEELARRLRRDRGQRPSLSGAHPADEVASLLAQRAAWYEAVAAAQVDATLPLAEVVAGVDALMRKQFTR